MSVELTVCADDKSLVHPDFLLCCLINVDLPVHGLQALAGLQEGLKP